MCAVAVVVGWRRFRRDWDFLDWTISLVVVITGKGARASESSRLRVVGVCGAWGFYGGPLMILKRGFNGFFRDEGSGVGGESQKWDLRACLALFQFLKNQGLGGLFGLRFWYF